MPESILEQIAAWHAAALAGITTANGYQQNLQVWRPDDLEVDGTAIKDLTTICSLGECVEDHQRTSGKYFWRQTFEAWVHLLGSASITPAVDTRITRVVADIHKRIGLELADAVTNKGRYCGGLAYRIDLLPWEIGVAQELNCTIVAVPVAIAFEVLAGDPYSQ